jgi:D-alanyl-D-alanine carboxypeptidase/D-alanyl-D-alanine-endopeptidase (penicillin-binding protein 4)
MGRRRRRVVGSLVAVLLVGSVGYSAADAYDVVPGLLTFDAAPPTPAPFPTAPGAAGAPAADTAIAQLDPEAPMPSPEVVGALAAALAADARMGTSVGIVVTDVLTGQVLADVDGSTPRNPASTTKVLTALAASSALGGERTLVTRVVQPEPGAVVLVGGGDMMLGAGAGNPDAVNGRAGLADLAAQTATALSAAGVTQVTLGLDDTLFAAPAWNPGWHDSHISYVAPTAALAVDVGKTQDAEYPRRYDDPAREAANVFATLLTSDGIAVTGLARTTAPSGATEIAAVESAPMREIVRYVVHHSENTVAEVLGRLVAIERGQPATFAGATSAVLAEVGAVSGFDTSGTVLADCSGLADGTRIPARLLVDLLVLASAPGSADLLPVAEDLPISGWQGTLFERFLDGVARGLVRAKTGSLPGVTSLAGTVLTVHGRLLAFAVLADATPPGGQEAPRAAIDGFVAQLVAQPPPA